MLQTYCFANISFLYCAVPYFVKPCRKDSKLLCTGTLSLQIFVKHITYLKHCIKIINTALAKNRKIPENSFNLLKHLRNERFAHHSTLKKKKKKVPSEGVSMFEYWKQISHFFIKLPWLMIIVNNFWVIWEEIIKVSL